MDQRRSWNISTVYCRLWVHLFLCFKGKYKNITKEETFVYRAETDSTSPADTSAGIYANGKVQTKKKPFT